MANYFYNGKELPDINTVWADKETYPYAYISEKNEFYYLTVSKIVFAIDNVEGPYLVDTTNTATIGNTVSYKLTDDAWVQCSSTRFRSLPVWASVDVTYKNCDGIEDGTIYLPASDPVPVGVLTDSDLYYKVNGQLVKHTLYKKVGGELIAYDDYIKEVSNE